MKTFELSNFSLEISRITNLEMPPRAWDLAVVSPKWQSYGHIKSAIEQRAMPDLVWWREKADTFGPFDQACSWFNYYEVMERVSRLFPEYVIMVTQTDHYGESAEDAWHNGRVLLHSEYPM